MPPKKKSDPVDATPVDVNAPRKTRNQKKAEEPKPPAPRPKPHRRAPGKQPAVIDEQFVIQRASGSQPHAASAAPVPASLSNPPPVVSGQAPPPPPAVPTPDTVAPAVADQRATPAPDPSNLFDQLTPPQANQRAVQRPEPNTPTTPSRRLTLPTADDIATEDDPPSRQGTPTPEDSDSESSSEEEDDHLPLPPGIDSFSDLGRTSKTKPVVKPGPIPAAAQEAAFLLHAQYQRNIEELAAKHGKSPESFYALLGSGSHLTRGRDFNSWAAWQAWYSVHGASKPDHITVADWTRHVSKEYVGHIFEGLNGRPDTPANRREVLEPTVQWYRERFANQ
ncbi:hypothetical protein H0H92_012223, partial [Tricholoma furcatifolium]